jgi:hypothetical protein
MAHAVPARPRRFQFSLRTMLATVALGALATSWLVSQIQWIAQRREFRAVHKSLDAVRMYGTCRAPGALPLFGEPGTEVIFLAKRHETAVRRLFPEADIGITPGWERTTAELKRLNERFPGFYQPTRYDE